MSKKLYFLITFVLALGLIGTARAEPCDVNLIGWWKFDEGTGNTVADSSAYNNNGVTVSPTPSWVGGYPGDPCDSAMDFDGLSDYVLCAERDGNNPGTYPAELMPDTFTIACWTKLDAFTFYGGFVGNGMDGECGFFLQNGGNANNFGLSLMTNGWWDVETPTPVIYDTDRWYHLAATYDGQYATVYVDGEIAEGPTNVGGPIRWNNAINDYPDNFTIGSWENWGESYPVDGIIDEVRFYNYAMPQVDIAILAGILPGAATKPSPRWGAKDVSLYTDLSWTAGTDATSHDVYFGTDEAAVDDANTSNTALYPGVYRGNQPLADVNYDPGILEINRTYYWRIDEVNETADTLIKGRVWSFTVANYIAVDDFDSYANEKALWNVWHDVYSGGVNSYVFLETDANFTQDGNSMEYQYNNYAGGGSLTYRYSVAEAHTADLEIGPDWTASGLKALAVHFYGQSGNAANPVTDRMWVALNDGTHTGVVRYSDMNDIKEASWHEWNIDLADPCLASVVMTNVYKISLGFGDRNKTKVNGGKGTVYFDGIRLHPPRCVPDVAYPYGDITGDCNVNGYDLEVMAGDWLASDASITATEPCDANLIGWWKFDEGTGNTVADSSAYNNTGVTESPTPTWVAGYPYDPCNSARYFDGLNNYYNVVCAKRVGTGPGTYPAELRPATFTISCWVKFVDYDEEYAALVTNGLDGACGFFLWNCTSSAGKGTGDFGMSMATGGVWNDIMPTNVYPANTWHHIAVSYDGQYANFYVNGVRTAGPQDMGGPMTWIGGGNYPAQFVIGAWEDPGYESLVHGAIDEVRFYNYALPWSEIAVLAGLHGSIYIPLNVPANLVHRVPDPAVDPHYYPDNPDIVNFKDFGVLADNWLKEVLFP